MVNNTTDNFIIVDEYVEPATINPTVIVEQTTTQPIINPPLNEPDGSSHSYHDLEMENLFRRYTEQSEGTVQPTSDGGTTAAEGTVNNEREEDDEDDEDDWVEQEDEEDNEDDLSELPPTLVDSDDLLDTTVDNPVVTIDVNNTTPVLTQEQVLSTTTDSRTRFKGAEWFTILNGKPILLIGQGGIGSWLTLFLSRIGCELFIYDMDVFETHNMSGQFVAFNSIGKSKVEAVKELVLQVSEEPVIHANNLEYTPSSPTNKIVLCGFDNMKGRKIAFERWVEYLEEIPNKAEALFIDGRLNAENLQVFAIQGDDENAINNYRNNYLFSDSEVEEQDCTFKQTTHCASIIAGIMTAILTNWACITYGTSSFRRVPFFTEFVVPVMYFNQE